MARRKSILDGLLYVLNTIAAFALMCSYLSTVVDPRYFSWFSFLGLAYPYLLLTNVLFAIWWALRLKLKIILPIVAISLGYQQIPTLYQFGGNNQVIAPGDKLKVMTYNVRMFNVFNWLEADDIPQRISQIIKEEDPDVLLIQEYHYLQEPVSIDFPYSYHEFPARKGGTGQIIYSKFPILEKGYVEYPIPEGQSKNGAALYADINWKGRMIRLINVHLASVGLQNEDYNNLATLNDKNTMELQRDLGKIGGDLKRAFIRRSYQTQALDSLISLSPYPLILAGDFNDPPSSYTYGSLNDKLEDSFLSAGKGLVRTYNRGPLPLRIDYILYDSSKLRCFDYKVRDEKLSDHYPVISEFGSR